MAGRTMGGAVRVWCAGDVVPRRDRALRASLVGGRPRLAGPGCRYANALPRGLRHGPLAEMQAADDADDAGQPGAGADSCRRTDTHALRVVRGLPESTGAQGATGGSVVRTDRARGARPRIAARSRGARARRFT